MMKLAHMHKFGNEHTHEDTQNFARLARQAAGADTHRVNASC